MKLVLVLFAAILVQENLAENSSEEVCPPKEYIVIREVTVCEIDRKKLECPAGSTIKIHEAFYGRRNTYTCRHQVMKKNVDVVCSSPKAIEVVQKRCSGRNSCDLTAHNSWFTDPCYSTYKYLQVAFSCTK
ncbi:unnamed protein product [Nezara viridula]|uniref:SUEL-type lectin domain-containing protein n=1 Tax=Nezara viridula TaxID=85310 RepID=A0A9P0EDJ1_NEZVI|nr:unnamed protein product [Nezara viridula]